MTSEDRRSLETISNIVSNIAIRNLRGVRDVDIDADCQNIRHELEKIQDRDNQWFELENKFNEPIDKT